MEVFSLVKDKVWGHLPPLSPENLTSEWIHNAHLIFFQANELPAELTKNERILHLLRSKEGPGKNELGSSLDR